MRLPLSPQVFAITARLVEEHSGLHYDASNIDLLADRLSERASELGFDSLLDYYYYLRYDEVGGAELSTLVDALTVHETYLFRELEPLEVLVRKVIPDLLRTRPRVRIWSAACATGEEPYTLLLLLEDAGLVDRTEIVASDISHRALAGAREGIYGGRSLRVADRHALSSRLCPAGQGRVRVKDALRQRVAWRRVNLVDREAIAALGSFDVVLCRNVLIYFADATVAHVARNLDSAMNRDGWLLVGASESLIRFGTLFAFEELGGAYFYRKSPKSGSPPEGAQIIEPRGAGLGSRGGDSGLGAKPQETGLRRAPACEAGVPSEAWHHFTERFTK